MASFITRQQHNNIPHVDRTPYSPQCSGGPAWPFRQELIPRLPTPLTQTLSFSCFVRLQPDHYIWILPRNPNPTHTRTYTQHGCMLFRVTVIKLTANNKFPTGKKRATRHHARGAMMQAAEPLQPYKAMHQSSGSKWLNLSTTAPLLHPHETLPILQK